MTNSSDERRKELKRSWISAFLQSLEERVERYLAVEKQLIIAHHHFARASSECIDLYRDGYFTSCIMLTQAVAEGIVKLVAERNDIQQKERERRENFVRRLNENNLVSSDFANAFVCISKSFRNDFHHMNPKVATIDVASLAEKNIMHLAVLEREIFGFDYGPDGTIVLKQPKYWDIDSSSIRSYVRFD
jgi:hypothetical protein